MPLLVFDLDGTLVDSQQDLADAVNALILERKGHPLSVDVVAGMIGEGARRLVRRALAAAGVTDNPDTALCRFLQLYDDRLLRRTRLYDGIEEAISELSRQAYLAVLTNKPAGSARRILEGLGIGSQFQAVVGGDGPFERKPDPSALRHLIEQAAATSDTTMMVGDSAVDVATARAAGVRIVLARYGFGFRLTPADLRGDELLIDRPSELVPTLRRHFL